MGFISSSGIIGSTLMQDAEKRAASHASHAHGGLARKQGKHPREAASSELEDKPTKQQRTAQAVLAPASGASGGASASTAGTHASSAAVEPAAVARAVMAVAAVVPAPVAPAHAVAPAPKLRAAAEGRGPGDQGTTSPAPV
jgi:hypothetical protein